jgi:hypothetical protein
LAPETAQKEVGTLLSLFDTMLNFVENLLENERDPRSGPMNDQDHSLSLSDPDRSLVLSHFLTNFLQNLASCQTSFRYSELMVDIIVVVCDEKQEDVTLIAIYVDDILVASRDLERITEIGRMLADQFKIKDLGDVKHCLGVEFSQVDGQVTMQQRDYVADVLATVWYV